MRFFRKCRLELAEREAAGLKAKLTACQKLADSVEKTVPGPIVMELIELPRKIAEVEVRIQQLSA